jgi:hypothetical protein
MKSCVFVVATLLLAGFVESKAPDFDYDFSGFTKLTQLLATTCTDIEGQVSIGLFNLSLVIFLEYQLCQG